MRTRNVRVQNTVQYNESVQFCRNEIGMVVSTFIELSCVRFGSDVREQLQSSRLTHQLVCKQVIRVSSAISSL